jgi:predicted DNA-binding transcriptional regulator AlpA
MAPTLHELIAAEKRGGTSLSGPALDTRPMLLTAKGIAFETGTSISTIWRWHAEDPTFPRAIKLGTGCTRWQRAEVEAWIASKADAAATMGVH